MLFYVIFIKYLYFAKSFLNYIDKRGIVMATSLIENRASETKTENIFRKFYKPDTFLEKSAIPSSFGFKSKRGTDYKGYPDFFLNKQSFAIVVEAKALKHSSAEDEVKWYMDNNSLNNGIIGIAISGQELNQLKVTYYYKENPQSEIVQLHIKDKLLSIESLENLYISKCRGETVSEEELTKLLKQLNETFHAEGKVRDTDRSLFFSGILIALRNKNFRNQYKHTTAPDVEETSVTDVTILEAHHLNKALLDAIETELKQKVNNLSKEYAWRDRFSFISNIDYHLDDYINIISLIEDKIFNPFINNEKLDILGKAYKLFLSRSGQAENKNIILTPDHIKSLMVKLARLDVDDVVIDTCMGSGGFLMEALEILISLAQDDIDKQDDIRQNQLIGFENDSVLFALACSNMFLHGDGRSNLMFRSSLLSDTSQAIVNNKDAVLLKKIREMKPTKCIINPPYERTSPIDFTKQALEYLEPNGKLIIIMPTPTLRKYQSEGGKTEEILNMAKLDFVIKMPFNLFSEQGRTVNTSIFGFTKTKHDPNDEVMFYNLEDDGFESIQHKGRVDVANRWNDIENEIIDIIQNSREIKGISEKRKIYKDSILNCSGYIELEKDAINSLVKFSDLFDISPKGSLASTKNDPTGKYDFITASDEWKKHSTYEYDTEAIVYAIYASGSLGKSQYVNGKFTPSNLCVVLTPKEDGLPISLKFYNWYLEVIRKQIVSDLADGTSKLTISRDDLHSDYYIEYFNIDIQNKFVEENIIPYEKLQQELQQEEEKLKNKMLDMI